MKKTAAKKRIQTNKTTIIARSAGAATDGSTIKPTGRKSVSLAPTTKKQSRVRATSGIQTSSPRPVGAIAARTPFRRRFVARFRRPSDVNPKPRLIPAWRIARQALLTLKGHWKLFGGITLIYALLWTLLIGGYSLKTDSSVRTALGTGNKLAGGLNGFLQVVTTSGSGASSNASTSVLVLALIGSLAVVWALRQVWAGSRGIRVRDAYYQGMYPLIPVILVGLVIVLELIPFFLGSAVYTITLSKSVATSPLEHILIVVIALLLMAVTVYLMLSTIIAAYVATLPDMTPLRAMRSARELVRYRRLSVLRKLVFWPVVVLIVMTAIMLPVVVLVTPVAAAVFLIISILILPCTHAYMYTLYRELLK